jgi:site-specific DNA-methyltransferase (adenine-specific)
MRPYYEDESVTIYHGDCREIALPRGLMVTDPPYNVGYHYDEYKDSMPDAEYWAFLGGVLRMPLVFLHYPEALFSVARLFHRVPDEVVAWVYHANTPKQWRALGWFGVTPDFSKDGQSYQNPNDRRVAQLIGAGKKARLYDWWQIEQVKNVSGEKTEHPCQIPTALMVRALRVTPFDGPVVDPFAGSGTTLLAAKELGRTAIGVERSERYCEIAAKRLSQGSLFAAAVNQ